MAKTKSKNQHVIPHGGKWAVRCEGNERSTSIHKTQSEAIEVARTIAKTQGTELVIHRADGRIRGRDSYAADPPPRAPRKVLFPLKSSVSDQQKIRTAVIEVMMERKGGNNNETI